MVYLRSVRIDDISITRSHVINAGGRFHLHAEVQGLKFDGFFDDIGGFLHAVSDLATFIAARNGKLSAAKASKFSSRDIAPGTVN